LPLVDHGCIAYAGRASSAKRRGCCHATVADHRTLLTRNHFCPLHDPNCDPVALEVLSGHGQQLTEIVDPARLDDLSQQLRPDPSGAGAQACRLIFDVPLFAPVPGLTFETFDSSLTEDALAQWSEWAAVNGQPFPRQTYVQWVRPLWTERRGPAFGLVVGKQTEVGTYGGGVFRVAAGQLCHIGNVGTRDRMTTPASWRSIGLA
jgi:hypothetical protein